MKGNTRGVAKEIKGILHEQDRCYSILSEEGDSHRSERERLKKGFQQKQVVRAAVKAVAVGEAVIKAVAVVKAECYLAIKALTQSFSFR